MPAHLTRRQFGKRALTGGLTAALAASPLACQSKTSPANQPAAGSEIEARYQQIIRRYGGRLSLEQRKRMRKILAYNEKLLAPIRAFPLDNGQPAATVLKFYEEAERKETAAGKGSGEEQNENLC
jgi:hypothetical protein